MLAEEAAGRDVREPRALGEQRCLGAFARSRRAEQNDTHGYFRNPS